MSPKGGHAFGARFSKNAGAPVPSIPSSTSTEETSMFDHVGPKGSALAASTRLDEQLLEPLDFRLESSGAPGGKP
jgi:hypothetical protein